MASDLQGQAAGKNMALSTAREEPATPSSAATALSVDVKASLMKQYYHATAPPPSAVECCARTDVQFARRQSAAAQQAA